MPSKRVGFVSTRLAGTDGVSLETAKLTILLDRLGHQSFYCAGELDSPSDHERVLELAITPCVVDSHLVSEMHFSHPDILAIHDAAFYNRPLPSLPSQIADFASTLKSHLHHFVSRFQIDLLFIQNALAIPMNIPLGVALADFIVETGIPAIAHNHDLYWERERFRENSISSVLEQCFPPNLPSLRHVVINSIAQDELNRRKGVESVVLPNIFDFAQAAPGLDTFNCDLRAALGLTPADLFILQPTRVIPRKGIELSIEMVRRLSAPENLSRLGKNPVLVITHHAGDEGLVYLQELQKEAARVGVRLVYAADQFAPQRATKGDRKIYSLWDAYVCADFVTYPSLLEGFGNALIETLYFHLPAVVNRYGVYAKDIARWGFDFVEIDGHVTEDAVEACIHAITDPVRRRQMVEWNYQLARQHYSYEAVMPLLEKLIED